MTATALDDASRMQVTVRGRVDIPGPEDITIDHEAGVAFVSPQQRRSDKGQLVVDPQKLPGGSIFALDLNGEPLTKRLLVNQESLGFPFHPRGLSLFRAENGTRRLMITSDRTSDDHVLELWLFRSKVRGRGFSWHLAMLHSGVIIPIWPQEISGAAS